MPTPGKRPDPRIKPADPLAAGVLTPDKVTSPGTPLTGLHLDPSLKLRRGRPSLSGGL